MFTLHNPFVVLVDRLPNKYRLNQYTGEPRPGASLHRHCTSLVSVHRLASCDQLYEALSLVEWPKLHLDSDNREKRTNRPWTNTRRLFLKEGTQQQMESMLEVWEATITSP